MPILRQGTRPSTGRPAGGRVLRLPCPLGAAGGRLPELRGADPRRGARRRLRELRLVSAALLTAALLAPKSLSADSGPSAKGVPRWLSPVRRESGKLVAEYASGVQTPRTADPSRRRFSPSALPFSARARAMEGEPSLTVPPRAAAPGPASSGRDPLSPHRSAGARGGLSVPPALVLAVSVGGHLPASTARTSSSMRGTAPGRPSTRGSRSRGGFAARRSVRTAQ